MNIVINNNNYTVKTVITNKDISKGMMNKKFDKNFDGMLFIMNKDQHNFWMKNCVVPLDIIFIDGNTIKKIHHNCQPCRSENCEKYFGNGDIVLELHGGECKKYNIIEGDKINFHY